MGGSSTSSPALILLYSKMSSVVQKCLLLAKSTERKQVKTVKLAARGETVQV